MTAKMTSNWPSDSTRFILPAIAIRGWRHGREIVLAWWIWRVTVSIGGGK
jgi:hypothetical protein